MSLQKYNDDFKRLEDAEEALKEIDLRTYNVPSPGDRAEKADQFRALVMTARGAVIDCHNALVEIESHDIDREEREG